MGDTSDMGNTGSASRADSQIGSLEDAAAYVASICFKHGPLERVGVELEWTIHHRDAPERPLSPAHLAATLGTHAPTTLVSHSSHTPLPSGSFLTVEPGGQVEISSQPSTSLASLIAAVDADIVALDALLEPAGLVRGETGIDQHRSPRRLLDLPRYDAMQSFFDRIGPWGSSMMCSTASAQVCFDAGDVDEARSRWLALHTVAPTMIALFANSPTMAGRDTGWVSNRFRAALSTCPPHTHPPSTSGDPAQNWADLAMTAPVLCVRREGGCWDAPASLTFANWVAGHGERRPTFGDLDYHLSTLFPPVRPRGYVEVRYLDAQPADSWHYPVVLLSALMSSAKAVDRAIEISERSADSWLTAARDGLGDAPLLETARDLIHLAAGHLSALDLPADVAGELVESLERRTSDPALRRHTA